MAANIFTGAGTLVSITALNTPPATDDAAGYAALVYTELGCVESLGTFGATRNQTEFICLNDGQINRLGGATDQGQLEMTIAFDDTNPAFDILMDAVESGLTHYVKIVLPNKLAAAGNGSIFYFGGKVTSSAVNVAGADDVVTITATITINTKPVRVKATATV